MTTRIWIPCALLGLVLGCAPTLETPDDGPDAGEDTPAGPVTHQDQGDGTVITTVNASDPEVWMYIDLESRTQVTPAAPETSDDWDLAFRRFNIKINGGVSGPGAMELVPLEGADFAALTQAPVAEYTTDQPDTPVEEGGDENEDPDFAFVTAADGWFDYSAMNHVLSPKDYVYAVRSVEATYYKLQILSYYDDVGTPAIFRFHWAPVQPPPATRRATP